MAGIADAYALECIREIATPDPIYFGVARQNLALELQNAAEEMGRLVVLRNRRILTEEEL